MTDEIEDKEAELEEDFDPSKAKTATLLDDALIEDETSLDDFQSDVPVEDEEEGGFNFHNSGEEDLSQYSY